MKRIDEVHFYEWRVSRWLSSEARAELDLSARGLYRECLDLCYANGSIPRDPILLARLCHCEPAEIEAIWPRIERHFSVLRSDKNRVQNRFANMFRNGFHAFKRDQKAKGKLGGRPKFNDSNEMKTTGFSKNNPVVSEQKTQAKKSRVEKSREEASEEENSELYVQPEADVSPPARPLAIVPNQRAEDIESVRVWLKEAAGPAAERLEEPDSEIARQVLSACGSLAAARNLLIGLSRRRRYPETSWAFYVSVAQGKMRSA